MEPLRLSRRVLLTTIAAFSLAGPVFAKESTGTEVVKNWYRLILELVRHTATYTPPVASRAFGYLGVTLWEAVAQARGLNSLAGQLNDLPAVPTSTGPLDEAALVHGALSAAIAELFFNTGPTGQRSLAAMTEKLGQRVASGLDADLYQASLLHGQQIALHVLAWAKTDGGAEIVNMGFPMEWQLGGQPHSWVPTSAQNLQQAPLLPDWGTNRPFVLTGPAPCGLPSYPTYSESPDSAFFAEAKEVYEVSAALTDEQKKIARFWSDDPMLSPTPPGHWISILLGVAERDDLPLDRLADGLVRLSIGVADAFIVCWRVKSEYDLLRPVTYIRRVIDKAWEPLLITPPFPEYPSGHSSQSGAAYAILEHVFGQNFAFTDATHVDDGLPERSFGSFKEAALEAALSRLYGGIHFRSAVEQGIAQGECVAGFVNELRTL